MRWFWIDRFVEFESGRCAVAIKNVNMVEEEIDLYTPGFPTLPSSVIIEGLAQAGGLVVGAHGDFKERVVLAKISNAVFHKPTLPGDALTLTARVQNLNASGAMVKGTCHKDDKLHAEVDLVFAHLDERFEGVEQFDPLELLVWLRMLAVFDVGRNPDGSPLEVPQHMREAEEAAKAADGHEQ